MAGCEPTCGATNIGGVSVSIGKARAALPTLTRDQAAGVARSRLRRREALAL